jgi:hypothetical protein
MADVNGLLSFIIGGTELVPRITYLANRSINRDFLSETCPENLRDKRGMRGKGLRSFLGLQLRRRRLQRKEPIARKE